MVFIYFDKREFASRKLMIRKDIVKLKLRKGISKSYKTGTFK